MKYIIEQYIEAHKNPSTEYEKWFCKALEMLYSEVNYLQNI